MLSRKSIPRSLRTSLVRILCAALLAALFAPSAEVFAQSSREAQIRSQIDNITAEMQRLEREIAQYSSLYSATTKEAQNLQNALKQLETNRKKLLAELSLTENKIKKTSLTIEDLASDIGDTEAEIGMNSKALTESLRYLNELEADSSIESFFKYETLSEALDYAMGIGRFQNKVNAEIIIAKDLRERLVRDKQKYESEKSNLVTYQKNLSSQKTSVEYTQKEKDKLLAETKNKEAEYQKLLAERKAQKDAFEQELFKYESELKLITDPSSIPSGRSGVLSWPLASIFVTQYFGKTVDSKRLYTSGSHNGVDFRASIGTPVKAALSGTVWATGNTDAYPGCYSYGKWVLIKHPNGLSSIYGHLSQIGVSTGATVNTGDIIGYSGNTGYSTGPHLHFGVYATQGVQVMKYTSSTYCKNATIPLADIKAYLDPMAYLPKP